MLRARKDPLIEDLVADLVRRHRCHTVVLYGSRARGAAGPESDYDVLAVRRSGPMTRDARVWRGAMIDAFVVGEVTLRATPVADLIKIHDGVVLEDKDGLGRRLLSRVRAAYARGPEALKPDEAEATRLWCVKMLKRIEAVAGEPGVSNYRRASILTELLPIYFQLRKRWFLGPRPALRWLAENDPPLSEAFHAALEPDASQAEMERLVRLVVGDWLLPAEPEPSARDQ